MTSTSSKTPVAPARWRTLVSARWLLPALLLLGAALFVIGTTIERNTDHHTTTEANGAHVEGSSEAEEAEGAEEGSEATEKVLGINLESTALIVVAVAASVVLAALSWHFLRGPVLGAVALFALVLAVFDLAEVVHQLLRPKVGLALLAFVVGAVHLVTAEIAHQRAST